jgi:hypothetical protein
MNCEIFRPYVSVLHDGEQIPDDAAAHIATCVSCRALLHEYQSISAEMRIQAAITKQQAESAGKPLPVLPSRNSWRLAMWQSMRIPRIAVAGFAVALVVMSIAWVRTKAQDKIVPQFELIIQRPCNYGPVPEDLGQEWHLLDIGKPSVFTSYSSWCTPVGIAGRAEVLSIGDGIVRLRLALAELNHAPPSEAEVKRALDSVAPQEITYVAGQVLNVPLKDGAVATVQGSIYRNTGRHTGRAEAKIAAGILSMSYPTLIQDHSKVIAFVGSGTSMAPDVTPANSPDGPEGIAIFVTPQELFFFGLEPFDGATQGLVGGSVLEFKEGEHVYTLYTSTPLAPPLTASEQGTRNVWVRHIKGYRPLPADPVNDGKAPHLGTGKLSWFLDRQKNPSGSPNQK